MSRFSAMRQGLRLVQGAHVIRDDAIHLRPPRISRRQPRMHVFRDERFDFLVLRVEPACKARTAFDSKPRVLELLLACIAPSASERDSKTDKSA